jgi:hypothetical protein
MTRRPGHLVAVGGNILEITHLFTTNVAKENNIVGQSFKDINKLSFKETNFA